MNNTSVTTKLTSNSSGLEISYALFEPTEPLVVFVEQSNP